MHKHKPIDMGFHDDELIGINIDLIKMEAVLKIKTFKWVKDDNPPQAIIREKNNDGSCYRAQQDKFVELRLKLKESEKFFASELSATIPQSILWTYIDGEDFSMTLVLSEIKCKVSEYNIVEVDALVA